MAALLGSSRGIWTWGCHFATETDSCCCFILKPCFRCRVTVFKKCFKVTFFNKSVSSVVLEFPRPSVACPSYFSSCQGPSRQTEHLAAPCLPGSVLYPTFMVVFVLYLLFHFLEHLLPGNVCVSCNPPCHVFSLGSLPLNSSCLMLCGFFLPEPLLMLFCV